MIRRALLIILLLLWLWAVLAPPTTPDPPAPVHHIDREFHDLRRIG